MPTEDQLKFCLEELRAIQGYIEERKVSLQKMFDAPPAESDNAYGDFNSLNWRTSKSGNGEYVNKSQVPAWVHEVDGAQSKGGVKIDGYLYVLFESGVLWRKKV